jgi:hypothetical protein
MNTTEFLLYAYKTVILGIYYDYNLTIVCLSLGCVVMVLNAYLTLHFASMAFDYINEFGKKDSATTQKLRKAAVVFFAFMLIWSQGRWFIMKEVDKIENYMDGSYNIYGDSMLAVW